jgi:GNAT superfamily N-acetyltransferase
MDCGKSPPKLRVFSAAWGGDELFIAEHPQPGVDLEHLRLLCSECWPKMLMRNARLGFDIHTHAHTSVCDSHCLTHRKGRFAQLMALRSLLTNTTSIFLLTKSIDGQPKLNGTCLIMASRVEFYIPWSLTRQFYYESIADPAEVRRQVIDVNRLRWAGAPLYTLDHHMLVFRAFESAYRAPNGRLSLPPAGDKSIGLHCVPIDSFDQSTESFRFFNNWGLEWGERGYGYVTMEYLNKYHHETFVSRWAKWGPSPYKSLRMLDPDAEPKEIRRLWSIQNPRHIHKVRYKGRTFRYILYETLSPCTNDRVTCVEITNGFGLKLGWCFLRHRTEEKSVTEITELFVWPIFRRQGIGRWLESAAVYYAECEESSEIHLIMNEADAVVGEPRGRARKFAKACGYDLRWREGVNPRSRAVGIKRLPGVERSNLHSWLCAVRSG